MWGLYPCAAKKGRDSCVVEGHLKKGIPSACFCHLPILEKIFLAGHGADMDIKLESDFQDTNWPFYFGNKIKV